MSKHALIFGSTGLIGTQLLHELANGAVLSPSTPMPARSAESGRAGDAGDDPSPDSGRTPAGEEGDAPAGLFDVVALVNRRPHPDQALIARHPNISERLFDFKDWSALSDLFTPHTRVFIALGTTRKKTPDEAQYQHIDRDLPIAIAKSAHAGGCASLQVVSAIGADAASRVFYNRTKGEMEEGVKQAFPSGPVLFYQPGLLLGPRAENRTGERIGEWIFAMADPFLRGSTSKYRSVHARDVARAMIFAASREVPSAIVHYDTMRSWSKALDG